MITVNAMKTIVLSIGGQRVLIDEDDAERVARIKWNVNGRYARCRSPMTIYMHRFIMNAVVGQSVDHKNGNPLDNRKENLRFCTMSQNIANSACRSSSSGFKGVYFDKRSQRWQAKIKVNYRSVYLGCYRTREEAAIVYNAGALAHFGAFALLNDVDES